MHRPANRSRSLSSIARGSSTTPNPLAAPSSLFARWRRMRPLVYLAAVERAFYAENQDITREEVLADVAEFIGLARDAFVAVHREAEVADATRADFALAPALGIAGFPSVLLQRERELVLLTAGWQPFASLEPVLRAWLAD